MPASPAAGAQDAAPESAVVLFPGAARCAPEELVVAPDGCFRCVRVRCRCLVYSRSRSRLARSVIRMRYVLRRTCLLVVLWMRHVLRCVPADCSGMWHVLRVASAGCSADADVLLECACWLFCGGRGTGRALFAFGVGAGRFAAGRFARVASRAFKAPGFGVATTAGRP